MMPPRDRPIRAGLLTGLAVVAASAAFTARLLLGSEQPAPATDEPLRPLADRAPVAFELARVESPPEPQPLEADDERLAGTVASPTLGACRVSGRVLRAGEPVSGVEVDARQHGGHGLMGVRSWRPILTDAAGCFEADFDRDATVVLRARDARSASRDVKLRTGRGPLSDVELELLPHFAIRGQVLDASGRPCPGLEVEAYRMDADSLPGSPTRSRPWSPDEVATADSSGLFELLVTSSGRYRLHVDSDQGAWRSQAEVVLVDRATPTAALLKLAASSR